jgi:transglutaminase-like putative cysteine protease
MYSDQRSKTVVFSSVDNGDVLHLRVRKEATGLQNLFGDFFGDLEPFQGRYPQKQFRAVVEAPLSRPLYWGGRGAPEPVITEEQRPGEQGTRIYDFTADDVAGVDGEAGMPPWLEIGRYLSLSTYKTWGDLGVWYEDLVRDQLRLDDDLKRVAKEIKGAAKDEADLVRRTYEYVVTQTRYVGIELGIHGWKPYPVSEVHRRRFGDCKDKASLLVALLRAQGVEAHLALVRTIQLGHEGTTPPSMWAFNHAIAFVPSLELFLDGTAEHSGWHELPTSDQGALSLIVDGKSSRLVTIPLGPADSNLNTSEYVLTLQPDGALVVDGTERFHGNHNAEQRRTFADPATRKETLERQLSSYIAGAAVTAVDMSPLGLEEEETHYRFQATLPKRAGVESDGTLVMPLSLYPHDLAGNYAEQSTRRYPLFFDHPWRTRNVMRYVLPRGYELAELPSGGTVHGDHIRFTQTVTRTKDGFVVDEDTAIIVRRVPLAEYERFRKDALAADKLMKRTLRIVKKGGV